MRRSILVVALVFVFGVTAIYAGTTGKIAGVVSDAENGAPLPGANVVIEGTTMGAASGVNGYYVILNIPPGIYTLKASMMGYSSVTVAQVRVNIDLTTTVDFKMKPQVIMGEEIQVVAERPVVQKDVSASQANLNAREIQSLPVVSVASVVALEAGVRGLEIRGGSIDQTAFMVNGFTLRDERNNQPYTAVSYTAIDEIQIQTGGFNAEYGNIRAGLINVVTKEGKKDRYHFGMITRYSPPAKKHFGHSPSSRESYWIRPYVDDAVCWTGTKNGAWDEYTQKQYVEFEGWNAVSEKTLKDDDPNNDLTPSAAQQVFLWEHRRKLDITKPDYDIDMSFGGPVPFISDQLGNLRFFASYRNSQNMYIVPLSRDAYRDYSGQLKITSDIRHGMKLTIDGLLGQQSGTNDNNSGEPGIFSDSWSIASALSNGPKYIDGRMYGTDYWCPSTVTRNSIGAKLTHVLSPNTFYELTMQRFQSRYDTNPGTPRDTSRIYKFGDNYYVDEAPFGYQPAPSTGIVGLRMGVGMSNSRDSSRVTVYSTRFDITSQVNRYNNIKGGFEFVYTDNYVNYASVDIFLPSGRSQSKWHTFPVRAALYVQDKLEFEGMIANVGLRMDYSHAGGEWYAYDDPWDRAFSAKYSMGIDTLLDKKPTKRIVNLSPRLGIAFPITIDSKLYFNYGHFRQLPTPENLYLLRRETATKYVMRIANPNNPLPKTVAYELGYEHNLFKQFLLRLAGYYRDSSLQPRAVTYQRDDGTVNYSVSKPFNYQDTRGFELTLRKNRGDWVQGFINYTYEVITSGNFGFAIYSNNPAEMRRIESETWRSYQEKPVPQPYARADLDLFMPQEFGPKFMGFYPLADWRLNILATWRAGRHFTWTGGGSIPGIENNVQWRDYYNVNMKFSRNFRIGSADIQLFVDVSNVFNLKYMTNYGFVDSQDYIAYMKSLHLPAKIGDELGYGNIPGNDRPGDYRTVPYEPYDPNDPDKERQKRILKTKAYIDMPNQQFFTFLDPRDIFWGIRVSFDIK
ncbi:MAG: TonB-dependent receptor [candidate division KSB1 bacterium]|nr:TonB-dependent receptor [candidate division KSB1 bacterium]MDZ7334635.1 TonB-dependent receptor [candidate division KSB1 bacterium]MDZ7357198.1 TonB-dependent receptor [candidate division KSB1 bacterium]MDZ7399450.1 TonB-dependent receptor [candidate division KSB1 bacterium]